MCMQNLPELVAAPAEKSQFLILLPNGSAHSRLRVPLVLNGGVDVVGFARFGLEPVSHNDLKVTLTGASCNRNDGPGNPVESLLAPNLRSAHALQSSASHYAVARVAHIALISSSLSIRTD